MRVPGPGFDPIEPGETDRFAFDFTADVGSAGMVSTAWTCALAPWQDPDADPAPQQRVISAGVAIAIAVRDPSTGQLGIRTGFFSTAILGGFPTTAIGAVYLIEASLTLSDGRTVKWSSSLRVTAPGA